MRLLKTLVPVAGLALAVAACSSGGGSDPGSASSDPAIVIGATLPLTGSLATLGAPLEAGYKLQIAHVNAAGGIDIGGVAERLKLVVMDNGGNPDTASSQASELVRRDHAVALLGSATTQLVTPTALVAEQLRVPFVTSLMPVEAFANTDKTGWTYSWDLSYDEQQQATDVARALAAAPGDKKVALFTDDDPDSVVERPLYKAAFKADGLDVVGDFTFPVGTTDFSSFIADAKAKGADLVAGQLTTADGDALSSQLKSSGFDPKAALVADPSDADGYWSPSEAAPKQLAAISGPLGQQYAGSPGYAAAAVGYAVAEVLTDALATAGSTKPAKLTTAISRTDAQTTAGPITFNQSTHTATTPYHVTPLG